MLLLRLFWASSALMLLCQQDSELKTMGEVKRWRFILQQREMDVKLSVLPMPNVTSRAVVSFEPAGDLRVTVSEQANLLRSVLQEMPLLGYNPAILESIPTALRTSEFEEGIVVAVTKAGIARSCDRKKYCHEAQPAANQFLRSIDAFKELDPVLHSFGLRRKGVFVDDLACSSKSGTNQQVRCDGLIFVVVERSR